MYFSNFFVIRIFNGKSLLNSISWSVVTHTVEFHHLFVHTCATKPLSRFVWFYLHLGDFALIVSPVDSVTSWLLFDCDIHCDQNKFSKYS